MDRFGLPGLQPIIRMQNNDQTAVAIGTDLHLPLPTLRSFPSPFSNTPTLEPLLSIPSCYTVPSAVPQQKKVQSFSDETLFYIFYSMPRDAMQEAAAVELMNRNWRFHKELGMWLTKDPLSEPVVQEGVQAERGIYIFFDVKRWEKVKKEYYLFYPAIA